MEWLNVDPLREERYTRMYANHREFVDFVAERMRAYPATRSAAQFPNRMLKDPTPHRAWNTPDGAGGARAQDSTVPLVCRL